MFDPGATEGRSFGGVKLVPKVVAYLVWLIFSLSEFSETINWLIWLEFGL